MIIDNIYEYMKTVEIDICTQKQCCLISTQNQTEGFTQASIETPCRSPDLLVYMDFIGFYLICPDLAWFSNLVLDVEIVTGNSRG